MQRYTRQEQGSLQKESSQKSQTFSPLHEIRESDWNRDEQDDRREIKRKLRRNVNQLVMINNQSYEREDHRDRDRDAQSREHKKDDGRNHAVYSFSVVIVLITILNRLGTIVQFSCKENRHRSKLSDGAIRSVFSKFLIRLFEHNRRDISPLDRVYRPEHH